MNITKVVFDDTVKTDIARVNRATGVLYINPAIWQRLTADEREFVLLHEKGHLELQTASEYEANNYAISKYLPVTSLTNAELGKRIRVITEITDPERYMSNFGADPVSAVSDALGSIFQALPMLGIGSKSRKAEQQAAADAAISLDKQKSASRQTMLIVGGLLFIVIMTLYLTFKK
jgi:hypothetical protein